MFEKIKELWNFDYLNKNKITLLTLLFIFVFSGFLRVYKFEEWLLFRVDQVRDANFSQDFLYKGFGGLQLLGPKITKVELAGEDNAETSNMGPAYYYLQAFSMKIFNRPDPWTVAFPDLILSILAIPLFYLILRPFFKFKTSALCTFFMGISFLIIQHSRFSWNPNQLIFWNLGLIYSFLKFSRLDNPGKWFLISFGILLMISQLHFLALVVVSLVFVSFYIYKKFWKKLKTKHYLFALVLFFLFHIPMIVSDIKNEGDNIKRIFAGVDERKSEDTLKDNFIENIGKSSRFYPYLILPISEQEFDFSDEIGFIYLSCSIILMLLIFFRNKKLSKKLKLNHYKDLTFIILVYFVSFFSVGLMIANSLGKARYWLLIAPITFLMLAFWIEIIFRMKLKVLSIIFLVVISGAIIFENFYSIYYWYLSQKEGEKVELPFKDPILREHGELITFGQIERAVDYMKKEIEGTGKGICYFSTDYQVKNSFQYVSNYKYKNTLIKNLNGETESSEDCKIFLISKKEQNLKDIKKYIVDRFEYYKIYRDGALVLWEMKIKEGLDFPARGSDIFDSNSEDGEIDTWREVFDN